MKKLILIVALLAMAGQAWGELTLEVFEKMRMGDKADKFAIEMYIGGVGKGYLQSNLELQSREQPPLFCYEGDYSTKQFIELASQHVKYIHSIDPTEKNIPMELVLLMKLKQMHPCVK